MLGPLRLGSLGPLSWQDLSLCGLWFLNTSWWMEELLRLLLLTLCPDLVWPPQAYVSLWKESSWSVLQDPEGSDAMGGEGLGAVQTQLAAPQSLFPCSEDQNDPIKLPKWHEE